MPEPFKTAITELVAQTVHEAYRSLPRNGKPIIRDDGRAEFTILAGFVLVNTASQDDNLLTICPSLATGMRCLPREKLPMNGDLLHDSHAEVLARRGLRYWLYDEVTRCSTSWLRRVPGRKALFALQESVKLFLYVSTLPCGDASMLLTTEKVVTGTRWDERTEETLGRRKFSHEYQQSISATLGTAQVARGRLGFDQPAGTLRTKPGRIDSLPSTSHSCADKLALWNVLGLQGALGSTILEPIRVSGYVFGAPGLPPHLDLHNLHTDLVRALVGRVELHIPKGCSSPTIWFTDLEFEFSQTSILRSNSQDRVVSAVNGLSYVHGYTAEVLDRHGSRQGAPTKRRSPGAPLSTKSRSRISKLELYRKHVETLNSLGLILADTTNSYYHSKHPQKIVDSQPISDKPEQGVIAYQKMKSCLRALPRSTFYGWIVHGLPWESFDIEGQIKVKESCDGHEDVMC
ncbi:hypothetical protein CROQUDRAFT_62125 [Cronartium quercuum f. sp. fusiforme G11]|uniref:A to I editase domain-containing protein n=1 Tax=Cronartium quercuum f. sp. fusiforme G11 TaxID=708437 RepID=A0A9P6TCW3_9BASI|nr:hypothetical protein CROQUDRAFT_62125 [Cronartium quercuum f. sp. fusiforme G11]